MSITFKVEDFDKGFAELVIDMGAMRGAKIETGLFTKAQATKGVRAEFGSTEEGVTTERARPWLSIAADEGEPTIAAAMDVAVGNVSRGVKPKAALEAVAKISTQLATDVIDQRRVGGPALAESTVKRKGHNQKLVDTGKMRAGIQSRVRVRKS